MQWGDDPPTEQLLTAETTIFILHQQSASDINAVMAFILYTEEVAEAIFLEK